MHITFSPTPNDDTAAAIAAAVSTLLEDEQEIAEERVAPRSSWSAAAALAAQGLPGTRETARARWAAAERARRETGWSYGIVGM